MSQTSKGVILVVDDEPLKRITLQVELSEAGYTVLEASDAEAARQHLLAQPVHVVISDVRMPGMDGMQFLQHIRAQWPRTQVILMTAYGSVDAAVQAIKRGAHDYLTKPFATENLLQRIERLRASENWAHHNGESEAADLPDGLRALGTASHASRQLIGQIQAVAAHQQPVLIEGEPGTGKSLIARLIHQHGPRRERPCLTLACANCPPADLEVALLKFFQEARGGTLYLDGVELLPPDAQRRLLHQLEQVNPSLQPQESTRLISSAAINLSLAAEQGAFPRELYYRLAGAVVAVPPLRDRREDIPGLAQQFLARSAGPAGRIRTVAPAALEALLAYNWPGNAREFEHVLTRAISLATGDTLELKDILLPQAATPATQQPTADKPPALTDTIAGIERKLIDAALAKAAGNQARAAQFLGIPRTTLRDKMTKYGMVGPAGKSAPAE